MKLTQVFAGAVKLTSALVGRAVSSPPFRVSLSIPAGGTTSPFSEWLSFTGARINLPQRRGSDTAPYQTADIQLHRSGLEGAMPTNCSYFLHGITVAVTLLVLGSVSCALAGEPGWSEIPPSQWKGNVQIEVPALKRMAAATIALPASLAKPLEVVSSTVQPPGLYEIRLTVRPSHVADSTAFHGGLRVKSGGLSCAEFPGQFFARAHAAESRTFQFVQPSAGSLQLTLEAFADPAAVEAARTAGKIKKGEIETTSNDANLDIDLGLTLTPDKAVYYLVDQVEYRPVSRSGRVTAVAIEKIRYNPGDKLTGSVAVADVGGKSGSGVITLYLEHNVRDRTKVGSLPVKLGPTPQTLPFEVSLPNEELGYALVAEFSTVEGADRNEAAEYFTIAANFNRVAIYGGNPGGTRDVTLEEEPIRRSLTASRADYFNACEYFAWAADDLLAMSTTNDYWYSGQTNYRMNRQTLQRQIRLAHEQGIAMVTYGKWCIDGPIGWNAVYDRPADFQGNYNHPVGMWESVNAITFDRRRNGEQVPYSPRPSGTGPWFDVWWNDFLGISPDTDAANVRESAEETLRSVALFGWDGIRWDGHPRGAGWAQCGHAGNYLAWAARQTQSVVRYFKEIVNAKYPKFGHGYNYLLIEPNKDYAWAVEDFELDELARGGGLLMNESIGNASGGWTFESEAHNLQVDSDLCRERGGFYLGISFAKSPRDLLIESALWAAAGCRPYGGMTRESRRYCTRYAQYTFDENLRRLANPEKVLAPQGTTRLWWQPFVYETPLIDGKRQLVVNLLNLPWDDKRPPRDTKVEPKWNMPPGTDPVTFALTLPAGVHATGANLIDPQTLVVVPLPLKEGRLEVPAVANWSVAVIDLAAEAGAPALAELYGTPKTFGVNRPNLKAEERRPEVTFDPTQEVWEVNKRMAGLAPDWVVKSTAEQAAFDALPAAERPAALFKKRSQTSPESLIKQWWKGGSLPDDLNLTNKVFAFGDLTPVRNGRFDIFHARGSMDYRLRLPQVFAGLDRFAVTDAPFWGGFRGGPGGMGLGNNVPWSRYPEFDLLLFTGIPHSAIGAENCYGMVEYVKAGGAAFFTGGEYAFGKGGYMFTVLERDLLPVLCTEMKDTRTSAQPVACEPGPDFSELKCKANFAAKPAFWVYNQVVLKDQPGIKVFLTSAKGPVLVGWQVGKGRVACFLVDYRGKSEKGTTAFFDWADWPDLARAVFAWLAPEAGQTGPARTGITADEAKKLLAKLDQDTLGDGSDLGVEGLGETSRSSSGRDRAKKSDSERVGTIRRLLTAPATAVDPAVMLGQLFMPGSLPNEVRWGVIDCVVAHPPTGLPDRVKAGLNHSDTAIRQTALQCLGAVDAAAVLREFNNPPSMPEGDQVGRMYALTLTLPLVKGPGLVDEARRRVGQWNAAEKEVFDKWTEGKGFTTAAPELPCLNAEALFQRIGWLAYLSRQDPQVYGAQFVREWLLTGTYQDYCWRTIGNKHPGDWQRLSAYLGRLRDLTRPDIEALLKTQPDVVAAGFGKAHFTLEYRAALNVLGGQDRTATAGILAKLKTAANPDLAAFAAARLETSEKRNAKP